MLRRTFALAAVLGGVGLAAPAHAAFVAPTSWDRSDPGVTYQAWDVFTGLTDQAPDVADQNANGAALLSETSGVAFVTSGGNLYSPTGPTAFTVTVPEADVPAPPHDVTAVVQIKTLGTELDDGSITLNGLAPVDRAELFRSELGGFGGADVETWLLFNVPYAAFGEGTPGVENLTLEFAAAGSSMSLDRLSIDTAVRPFGFYDEANPVPEPTSAAVLLAGVALVARRRRA